MINNSALATDQLWRLRAQLREEATRVGRADVVRLLDEMQPIDATGPIRACVVGETKRGKSSLLNALVGRPLLSPVGVDVTTSCWVEVTFGEPEMAEVILANPDAADRPTRRRCGLAELAQYVALDEVRDPVIGVQAWIAEPALRDLVLVDTPGVGGLEAGHTTTTLAALRKADALLFVCDSGQPILRPELRFLAEAARRVPTVVVAATKRDINPEFEYVVGETRQLIAGTPGLENVPVLAVAAPMADLAAQVHDTERASRLRSLSGVESLLDTLRGYSSAGAASVRFENAARVLAEACRALLARSDEIVAILSGSTTRDERLRREMAELEVTLHDDRRLVALVHDRLDRLRRDHLAEFDEAVEAMRRRYRGTAERSTGSGSNLTASRMIGELSGTAVDALESTARDCTRVVVDLMDQLGGGDRWPMTAATSPRRFEIGLDPPDLSGKRGGVDLVASAEMFAKLVDILAAPVVVMTVLTGPGIIAAGLALTAGAGYYKAATTGEHERRAALVAWVDDAAEQTKTTFRRETDQRVRSAERHIEDSLPHVLASRRRELARVAAELDEIRSSSASLQSELVRHRASASALHGIEREIDELVVWATTTRRRREPS
jgi:Dynamin family